MEKKSKFLTNALLLYKKANRIQVKVLDSDKLTNYRVTNVETLSCNIHVYKTNIFLPTDKDSSFQAAFEADQVEECTPLCDNNNLFLSYLLEFAVKHTVLMAKLIIKNKFHYKISSRNI